MKAFKDAQKRDALRGSTISVGHKGAGKGTGKTSAKGNKSSTSTSAKEEVVFQPHRDVIDAGKVVRELGDHIDTRYLDHEDLDQLDAGLGLNHESEGQAMIDDARTAAGDKRQSVIASVKTHLFGGKHAPMKFPVTGVVVPSTEAAPITQPPSIEAKMAFVGHNRNTVTCCTVLDMTIYYGDKTGYVFRAEPNLHYNNKNGRLSTSANDNDGNTYNFYTRTALNPKHKGAVLSIAVSDTRGNRPANWGKERSSVDMSVLNYLVSGGADGAIHVWKAVAGEYVGILKMHRAPVTGLCFRQWSSMLVSASADSTVRLWSVPEMHCEDKFFGHNGPVNNISSLRKERCATAGADRTVRHWKLDAATQVEFQTGGSPAECVAMIDDVHIVAGSTSGELFLFDINKRNPLQTIEQPHGLGYVGDGTGLEMVEGSPSPIAASRGNAITAIAALPYGDLVATASYSGTIALWHFAGFAATATSAPKGSKSTNGDAAAATPRPTNRLELVATFPCAGCVNSLQFSPNGSVLIGSIGKEQRTGRWLTVKSALNGVLIVPLHDKGEDEVRAITATPTITSAVSNNSAKSDVTARKMHRPLVEDPSHQPLTEEAKQEARKKKRQEIIKRRKEARELAKKKRLTAAEEDNDDEEEAGDEIDRWGEDDAVEGAPSRKKPLSEKAKKAKKVLQTSSTRNVVEDLQTTIISEDEDDDNFNPIAGLEDVEEEDDGPSFKLGKDGQFVFGDDDAERDDAEDEVVSHLRKKSSGQLSGKKVKGKATKKQSEAPQKKVHTGGVLTSRKSSASPSTKKTKALRK